LADTPRVAQTNDHPVNLGSSTQPALILSISGKEASSDTAESGVPPTPTHSSSSFKVRFTPKSPGEKSTVLRFRFPDRSETFDVVLTGTCTAPEITVKVPGEGDLKNKKSTVDFGGASSGPPVKKTFTIKNTGKAWLKSLQVTLGGGDKGSFKITQPEKVKLKPGAKTTFTVTFTPRAGSRQIAAIRIKSNDADEDPFVIALKGGDKASAPRPATSLSRAPSTRNRLETTTSAQWVDGIRYLSLTVRKSEGVPCGSHLVEVSPNLTDWFSGPKHTTVLRDDAQYLIVRDNTPGSKRHIRLKPPGTRN
jgi:hypothetical protein